MNDTASLSPGTAESFWPTYAPPPDVYDEMFAGPGEIRSHWQSFQKAIEALGKKEFTRRWTQTQRLVHQNGMAYSGYGNGKSRPRPWTLDAFPVLIPGAEWERVSTALRQRARLLNLVLKDLHGPQNLLEQGLLPPEVLYLHPGFLRPYHGISSPDDCLLHLYAADLARSPDGQWWILADRTESPSGAGYALENRIVISRMLPDIFHRCRVERLAPYFVALRETLHQLAPAHRDNPHVVMLSQGPNYPNYFEDAYLARYLGYTLVEADDLAVRNNQVMLKTLGGLLPVDVMLRRPNSEDCDPLELSATSGTGVSGLLQAVRDRKVTASNPLGSGLVESPIFMAVLPKLCQALLGEELRLPGVATWWCGHPADLNHVINNIDTLVVRHAFRRRGRELSRSQELNALPKNELIERLKANPSQYVGQERVLRSSTPVWSKQGGLKPSHIALRSFLVASQEDYTVMQGGLARVCLSNEVWEISLMVGESSKDVWVLAENDINQVSLLPTLSKPLQLRRSGSELPSRVADNLFWLGRHLERADASARLIRAVTLRLTSETDAEEVIELPTLIRALARMGDIEPGFAVEELRTLLPAFEQFLPQAIFDEEEPSSLRSVLSQMYRAAARVRDRISVDSWGITNRIDQRFRPIVDGQMDLADVLSLVNELIIDLASFSGMAMESMTRTQGWRFLDLGRRLERSLQIIGLVKCSIAHPGPLNVSLLEAVLEVADSSMTYRSRYLANVQLSAVLDLLLTDETNPRSVSYQLAMIADHVDNLPRDRSQPLFAVEERLAMTCLHSIRMINVQELADLFSLGERYHLEKILSELESGLPRLSDAIYHKYLIHSGPAHQLAEIRPE